MMLWLGDEIEYRTSDGKTLKGMVAGVSGSRIYFQNGGITYESNFLRKIETEENEKK
ncbi:hypothetical protein [Paenibacillus sp. NRS-1760]|uniref:hypothetical protein n=1 Tax=Paenibacillus sp. NRS-1760 TaxID=3233902 RepID=UPI003D2C0DDB